MSKSGSSAGAGSLGNWTTANWASDHGTSSSGKEGSAVKSIQAGAGSESLTTADSWTGVGSQSLTYHRQSGSHFLRNWMSSDKSLATSSETSPGDPSPPVVEVTADTSPPQNRSVLDQPDGLPGGQLIQVKIRRRLLTQLRQGLISEPDAQ